MVSNLMHSVVAPPPSPDQAVGTAASGLSNGIVDGFTSNIQYVIPVLVLFTLIGVVKRHTGAKKG